MRQPKAARMREDTSGFTIVELLIVIIVIAILATISVVAYAGMQQRARDSIRKSDLEQIAKAVELYHAENGRYPMTNGWCTQISNPGYATTFKNALVPYLSQVPYDPLYKGTAQDYFYQNIGGTSYYLYAELEGEDRTQDGVYGCVRTGGVDNEYDYRVPGF